MHPHTDPQSPEATPERSRPPQIRAATAALMRHLQSLRSPWTLLLPAPFAFWVLVQAARHAVRGEHVILLIVVIALTVGGKRARRLFTIGYPMILFSVVYDAAAVARRTVQISPASVHICDLREAELRWFSVPFSSEHITLQDFWQAHPSRWLDLLCSVPYGLFIYAMVAFGTYLYFKSHDTLRWLGWAFLLTNIAGLITYQLYPAAPPWYIRAHGCIADMTVRTSEGPALARVDAMLGLRYFGSMYTRGVTVFGAVPSLHVAYPLLMAITGFRIHGLLGRILLVTWYVWMCFAAVYLDHHWVIDILLGSIYAAVACLAVFAVLTPRESARAGGQAEEVAQ